MDVRPHVLIRQVPRGQLRSARPRMDKEARDGQVAPDPHLNIQDRLEVEAQLPAVHQAHGVEHQ